jgi:hypothetical protein
MRSHIVRSAVHHCITVSCRLGHLLPRAALEASLLLCFALNSLPNYVPLFYCVLQAGAPPSTLFPQRTLHS